MPGRGKGFERLWRWWEAWENKTRPVSDRLLSKVVVHGDDRGRHGCVDDALHGKEPSAGRITLELATGRLATTAITVFELESGARRPKQRDQVQALLAAMNLLPLNQKAAQRAAEIRGALEAKGQGIGTADYLIAGIVLEHSGILLTRNRAHFERVPGLILGTEICD